MSEQHAYEISYGKCRVPVYRVHARPLVGVTPIPESEVTGRTNTLLALEVDVEVFGQNFLRSYTHGDNTEVVATDSMKNVVLKQALVFDGDTPEAYLAFLGRTLLDRYPHIERLQVTGRELPFRAVTVTGAGGPATSAALFSAEHGDSGLASLDLRRGDDAPRIADHRCGRLGLQLLKLTGSAFTRFVRDEHTTLPERVDRPLFIFIDVFWRYGVADDMLRPQTYVPSEQVRDLLSAVFDGFVSESIQHLVHEMGTQALARFPQLAEISFEAQNRTWDPMAISDADPMVKVYSTPFPAHGLIKLRMTRKDGGAGWPREG